MGENLETYSNFLGQSKGLSFCLQFFSFELSDQVYLPLPMEGAKASVCYFFLSIAHCTELSSLLGNELSKVIMQFVGTYKDRQIR